MLQVEDSSDGVGGGNLVSSVSSLFQVKSVTAGEIEILRSRLVVSHAVDNLRLFIDASPRYFPLIGHWIARRNHNALSQPGLFGMGGFAWGSESIQVDQFDVPPVLEDERFAITALGNGRYQLAGEGLDKPVEGRVGTPEAFQSNSGEVFPSRRACGRKPAKPTHLTAIRIARGA